MRENIFNLNCVNLLEVSEGTITNSTVTFVDSVVVDCVFLLNKGKALAIAHALAYASLYSQTIYRKNFKKEFTEEYNIYFKIYNSLTLNKQ